MNELEQAREAATIKCDHEWLTSYLIPRCRKCGHTEHTILCLNQGIRQGFDAGRKFGSSEQAAEIERLRKRIAFAERQLRQYADRERWSDTAENSSGRINLKFAEVFHSAPADGFDIADRYFDKYPDSDLKALAEQENDKEP